MNYLVIIQRIHGVHVLSFVRENLIRYLGSILLVVVVV